MKGGTRPSIASNLLEAMDEAALFIHFIHFYIYILMTLQTDRQADREREL